MNIQTLHLRYENAEDRVLWQIVGTEADGAEKTLSVWLTRRLLLRLLQPYQQVLARTELARLSPKATLMPETSAMLVQAARERSLEGAQLKADPKATQPPQPVVQAWLPVSVQLTQREGSSALGLRLTESSGKSLNLQLGSEMATGFLQMVERVLNDADWGVRFAPSAEQPAQNAETPPAVLN